MTLPTSLCGRYVRYKEDTSIFATWLQLAATACGYTTVTEGQTSSKKNATAPAKISYPVDTLTYQAKAVANCATVQIQVPSKVLHAAERAIASRQQLNKHFVQLDAKDPSNATHVHFIQVLDETLQILKPLNNVKDIGSKTVPAPETKSSITLANKFGVLQVEATSGDVDSFPEKHIWSSDRAEPTVTLLEDADHAVHVKVEKIIRILALFEDFQDIQLFVQGTWKKYRNGELDLSTTSMLTSAAMALVKYECQQLAEDLDVNPQASYNDFMMLLQPMMKKTSSFSLHAMLDTPLGHFCNVEIAVTMDEYIKTMDNNLISRTFPILPSLRWVPDDATFLSSHPVLSNIMQRQRLLRHMMVDFVNRERAVRSQFSDRARQHGQIGTNELMTAIGSGIVDRMVSTHAVVAAKFLLDIDAILGRDRDRPFTELCSLAGECTKALHHTNLTSDIKSGPQWGAEDSPLSISIHEALGQIDDLCMLSASGPILRNPVFRGMQMVNIELLMEDAGTRLANYHSSLIILAYLYNALNQKNLISIKWPDLDTAIAAHKDSLFFGSIPTTPKDIAMRLSLRLGLSLSAYLDLDPKLLKGMRPGQNTVKVKKGGKAKVGAKSKLDANCLRMTATSQAWEQYFTGQEDLVRVIHHIIAIANKNSPTEEDQPSKHAARAMGPVNFLTKLQDWLVSHRQFAKISYVQLTRDCHELMEQILASNQIKGRIEGDLKHLLSAADRKVFEDDRNNVPGASTTHTVRYLDVVNKILVEDKERTQYPRELDFADSIGLGDGWALGKVSGFVQRYIEAKVGSGRQA